MIAGNVSRLRARPVVVSNTSKPVGREMRAQRPSGERKKRPALPAAITFVSAPVSASTCHRSLLINPPPRPRRCGPPPAAPPGKGRGGRVRKGRAPPPPPRGGVVAAIPPPPPGRG